MLDIKTLIELFDDVQIENVVAGLRFKPERIVFIGFKKTMNNAKKNALNNFFAGRSENIVVEYEIVGRYDYNAIIDRLNYILDKYEDCCFDLTGGKELVIAAMSTVATLRNIPMFQINVENGDFIRVKNCENIAETERSHLTLAESVSLNGCEITHFESEDYDWNLNSEFRQDVEKIWEICKVNCGLWNSQSRAFDKFEKFGKIDNTLTVTVNLQHMKNVNQKATLCENIINQLIEQSIIFDYALQDDILTYRYKNEQVRLCITKAGNILELYAYILLMEIAEEEPGYYDDMDIGVFIDWDGIIHTRADKQKDTKNEVDIMVMRDLIPIFISCKNGEVDKEALYELSVVAGKFGGRYAKKVLLATYVNANAEKRMYIKKRAEDMNIAVLDNVNEKTREELKADLKQIIK